MVWHNPEFIRHVRSQLRPANLRGGVFVVWMVCILIGILMYTDRKSFFEEYYFTLLTLQFVFAGGGVAIACGRAILRERMFQTFDFWRTTRLTSYELVTGMIGGAPVTMYFALVCSLPFSLWAGSVAGFSPLVLAGTYLLLLGFSLFVGVLALWISMLTDRPQGGTSIGSSGIAVVMSLGFLGSILFLEFISLNPYYAIGALHGISLGQWYKEHPVFFGQSIPHLLASLLLYICFGFWFALMLVRNVKKGLEEIILLSRWQIVGFIFFMNFLWLAFLNVERSNSTTVFYKFLTLHGFLLYFAGLLSLIPFERLRVWRQNQGQGWKAYLSEDGPSFLFLGLATVGVALEIGVGLMILPEDLSKIFREKFGYLTLGLGILLVFAVRDSLFLQWCRLTNWKNPLRGGLLYLSLYYFAVFVLLGTVTRGNHDVFFSLLMTPLGVFHLDTWSKVDLSTVVLVIAIQGSIVFLLWYAVVSKLQRPLVNPSPIAG